jgi:hypothetical protein
MSHLAHDARIDLRIPRAWRDRLDQLAEQVGLTAPDLGRLAIRQFLLRRNLSLKMETTDHDRK